MKFGVEPSPLRRDASGGGGKGATGKHHFSLTETISSVDLCEHRAPRRSGAAGAAGGARQKFLRNSDSSESATAAAGGTASAVMMSSTAVSVHQYQHIMMARRMEVKPLIRLLMT